MTPSRRDGRLVLVLVGGALLLFAMTAAGCSSSPTSPPGSGGNGDPGSDGGGVVPDGDPLAQPPADDAGLTNVSGDLDAILEHGALDGACDRYRAGATDRHARLLCGKQMFFYETFGTSGVPTVLAQFLVDNFPKQIGPGFAKQGMIEDPTSATHLPLGLASTAKLNGTIDALAFTCASCHFARLPDGRYAVGAANHSYEYGRQILSLMLLPSVALLGGASGHDPDAIAAVQPLLDEINADPTLKQKLLAAVLPLSSGTGGMLPMISVENEHHYASWRAGTMDFLIQPLPIDDTVHTVSKISALWSLPTPDELAADGLPSAWIGWTGGTASLMDFLHGFVSFGGGPADQWTDADLQPLADYIYSLRAPANPTPPPAELVEHGRQLFASDGCSDCHDGPRGGGRQLYDFDQIGTDDAMRDWLDPSGSGTPCCNLPADSKVTLTHQIKSPRLVGSWAMSRFLHDGALTTLEALFCLSPRPTVTEPAMGAAGHDMTCTIPEDDKRALMAYLLAR